MSLWLFHCMVSGVVDDEKKVVRYGDGDDIDEDYGLFMWCLNMIKVDKDGGYVCKMMMMELNEDGGVGRERRDKRNEEKNECYVLLWFIVFLFRRVISS